MKRLSGRSARLRDGRFVAEGPQAVREAVAAHAAAANSGSPPVVLEFYVTADGAARHPSIVADARACGVEPRPVSDQVLAAMADTVTPQGMVAVCALPATPLETVMEGAPRLVALLARVRDPGNAGTVIRVSDASGADAVVLSAESVDPFNPKAVRSTAGSIFHLPVVFGPTLDDAVQVARSAGLVVLAADGAGDVDLDELQDEADGVGDALLRRPTMWIFGNEAWGLPQEDRALADAVVRVPIRGRAESLNLATAATLCLYASARAHRPSSRSS